MVAAPDPNRGDGASRGLTARERETLRAIESELEIAGGLPPSEIRLPAQLPLWTKYAAVGMLACCVLFGLVVAPAVLVFVLVTLLMLGAPGILWAAFERRRRPPDR